MFGDTLWAPPQEPNSQQLPGPVLILIHGIDIAHPEEGETREKPLWGGFMWVTQSWTHHLGFNPPFRVMLLLGVVYDWVYHSMEIWWVDNLQPTILIFESEDIMFL